MRFESWVSAYFLIGSALVASHDSCILLSLVCTVLRMLVKAVFLAADDWSSW